MAADPHDHDPRRRRLLLGSVAGATVAALGAVEAAASPSPRAWLHEADIVIAGSGAAALTAAAFAQSLGERVLVLEKGPIT
ncbi:MAG TPA: FAD-binding protein, partial [Steroidobacteraceae bacterium]